MVNNMVKFSRNDETFEVEMGEDLWKIILRPRKTPYTQSFVKKFMEHLNEAVQKVVILPPDVDVIVVHSDGSMEKY